MRTTRTVALTLCLMALAASAFSTTYNLWNDWNSYNPVGPWTYGRFINGPQGQFDRLTYRWTNPELDLITVHRVHWHDRRDYLALDWSSQVIRYDGPAYDETNPALGRFGWQQTGEIRVVPDGDAPASADWGVIRWTAPAAGSAKSNIGIYARNNWGYCTVDAQIQRNRAMVAQASIYGFDGSPTQSAVTFPGYVTRLEHSVTWQVKAGDTIDVAIGNQNGSNGWDDATVEWNIDFSPYDPPEPPDATPPAPEWDVMSDTWTATDALGRDLPGFAECGPPREGKHIIMEYSPWLTEVSGANYRGPYDMSLIFEEAARRGPYTLEDIFTNEQVLQNVMRDPTLPWGPMGLPHFWSKPELGYYLSDDEYVVRKHTQMLADAQVDIITLDLTNTIDYPRAVETIINTFRQIRAEGGNTPQISFFVHWCSQYWAPAVHALYVEPDPNSELWFRWEGKPLLIANLDDSMHPNLLDYYTIRKSFGLAPDGPKHWPFVGLHPQPYGYASDPAVPEQIPANICQGDAGTYGAVQMSRMYGRNYHNGTRPPYSAWDYTGRNFAEQWQRAMDVDPSFIWIFDWNEWASSVYYDDVPGLYVLTGNMCHEYSYDLEPMEGGSGDIYYYQMMSNIRRYKGVRQIEAASGPKTVAIDGDFSDWLDVFPEYRDHIGDTAHRDHHGWGFVDPDDPTSPRLHYTNFTGRNDLVRVKVARDADYVYFYAETKDSLTPYTGPNWMLLYIDSDSNGRTGWHGYEYLVNSRVIDSTTTSLKRWSGSSWVSVGNVSYATAGNKLEVRIPRAWIGKGGGSDLALDFHWADNTQSTTDIREFSLNGDSAPNRICRYRYNSIGGAADTTAPAGTIWINSGADYTCLTTVSLALNAVDSGSVVSHMRLSNDGMSWDSWVPCSSTKSWALTPGDGAKRVYVQYRDSAGNASGSFSDSIILETVPPSGSIVINGGAEYTTSTGVALTLSANDAGSGVASMRFSNDGVGWSAWESYSGTKSWTLISGDGAKSVYAQFRDAAANLSAVYSDEIMLSGSGHLGSITINSGAVYTVYTLVSLSLSSPDAVQMRFSNDNSSWTGWEAYGVSKSWALATGDGTKTVHVQFKSGSEAISGSFSDTIVLDTMGPAGVVSIDSGAGYTNSTAATLTLRAVDPISGVSQMRFSNNGVTWSAWESYGPSKSWTLTSGVGIKMVYVRYRDNAGNQSAAFSDTIVLETTPPVGSISINGGTDITNSTSVTLTLSATDSESGVSQMRFSSDGAGWGTWEPYNTTRPWVLSDGDGTKSVYVQYKDNAGNESIGYSDTIQLQGGVIRINGGDEYTRFTTVSLSLSYVDAAQMRFSSDGGNWSNWETYKTSRFWSLAGGDGTKSVYVQYKTSGGTVSASFSDTIVLDTSAPGGAISVAGGALYTGTASVDLTISGTDSGSGLSRMKFSTNAVTWSGWEPYALTKSWSLSGGYGLRSVYAKFEDAAGNSSSTASDQIWLVERVGVSVAGVKSAADGVTVGMSSKIVTAVFADAVYVEEADRSSGIRVRPTGGVPAGLEAGDVVDVAGYIWTDPAGERWIEAGLLVR